MFETKKTLIVVYKDELLMNQLKKLIETKDDNDNGVVGTKDNSINVVSWDEKTWLTQKKAGNITGKVLFLDKIKDTDKLIPVLDIKINESGVKFGWAGNQAQLFVEPSELIKREDYDEFLKKLSALPVPDFLKTTKESVITTGIIPMPTNPFGFGNEKKDTEKLKIQVPDFLKTVGDAFAAGADAITKVGDQIATRTEELFRNKELMKRQMLFYGVVRLYNDGLEEFMER
ncbi:MAG: hypothetical protein ACI4OJ_07100 [Lachnospiraceae bacterium]